MVPAEIALGKATSSTAWMSDEANVSAKLAVKATIAIRCIALLGFTCRKSRPLTLTRGEVARRASDLCCRPVILRPDPSILPAFANFHRAAIGRGVLGELAVDIASHGKAVF